MAVTEMALGSEMTMLLDAIEEARILVREDLTVAYANRASKSIGISSSLPKAV